MPIASIPAEDYAIIEFEELSREIRLHIEAERAVDIFVLDEDGFDEFEDDDCDAFHHWASFTRKKKVRRRLAAPDSYPWFIVIDNPHDEEIAFFYEVFRR